MISYEEVNKKPILNVGDVMIDDVNGVSVVIHVGILSVIISGLGSKETKTMIDTEMFNVNFRLFKGTITIS